MITLKSTAQTALQTYKKLIIHGQSGIGKTMLAATAAPFKPLIILTEKTGDESLQPSAIVEAFGADREDILYDIDLIEAFDPDTFEEAIRYAIDSEDHNLVIFDSMSKGSRLILKAAKSENSHGMKAYGQHNDEAMALIETLLESDKHVVLLCHTSRQEDSSSTPKTDSRWKSSPASTAPLTPGSSANTASSMLSISWTTDLILGITI